MLKKAMIKHIRLIGLVANMLKKLLVNFVFLLVGAIVVTAIASSFVYFGSNAAAKIGSVVGSDNQSRCTERDLATRLEFSVDKTHTIDWFGGEHAEETTG
jgi:hypothetical protein